MITDKNYRLAPRLAVAGLIGLAAVAAPVAQATAQDPPGNNGTVKIAPHGDIDSIPNNTPHVGCSFDVEWYGFDEGPDIVSHVDFAEQAPTTGVGLAVSGPADVFVGGDPATGAGTPTGLDGRETYTLSFTGAPHPQQGYHVRLTISTPGSIGNDTKTKVFWVEGCGTSTPPTTTPPTSTPPTSTPPSTTPPTSTPPTTTPPSTTPPTTTPPSTTPPSTTPPSTTPPTTVPQPEESPSQTPDVLGEQAFGPHGSKGNGGGNGAGGAGTSPSRQQLPTVVDAGSAGQAGSPGSGDHLALGGLLLVLGLLGAAVGWRRARG